LRPSQFGVPAKEAGGDELGGDGAGATVERLDDGRTVNRRRDSLPHLEVVERLCVQVHVDVGDVHRRPEDDREVPRVTPRVDHVLGVGVLHHVNVVGAERKEARGIVGDDSDDDTIDAGGLSPVVGVPIQDDAVPGCPRHELKGPGTDRIAAEGGEAGGGGVGADDGEREEREVEEEGPLRRLEVDLDGVEVDDVDAPDDVGKAGDVVKVLEGDSTGDGLLVPDVVGVHPAVEVPLDSASVEWGAVVEADALAEIEEVGQAIWRDVPGAGESGLEVGARPTEHDEGVEYLLGDAS